MLLDPIHPQAEFLSNLSGGVDRSGFSTFSGQVVSLENWLLWLLPTPLANLVHKAALVLLAWWGTYRLARNVGANRSLALAAAAFVTFGHERMLAMTWSHGMGFAMAPLLCWLVVKKARKFSHWALVVAACALFAVSCTPTHSFIAALWAVALTGLTHPRGNIKKVVVIITILALFVILNWHEGLFAKYLIGPYTERDGARDFDLRMTGAAALLLALCVVFWGLSGRAVLMRMLPLLALAVAGGGIIQWLTGELRLLKPVSAMNYHNLDASIPLLAAMWSVSAVDGVTASRLRRKIRDACLFALAGFQALSFLLWLPAAWLNDGGLSVVMSPLKQLRQHDWLGDQPVRVVSMPYRMPSNVAAAAGLDTFDGFYPLIYKNVKRYWDAILYPAEVQAASGSLSLEDSGIDPRCCDSYDLTKIARLDLLRSANVGFVLSILPLTGEGVVQVSGPNSASALNTASASFVQRLARNFNLLMTPPELRVYSIGKAAPRLYSVAGLVPEAAGDPVFPDRATLAPEAASDAFRTGDYPLLTIVHSQLIENGAELVLKSAEAPGLVVFNTPYVPFWHAYADGVETVLTTVDMFKIAALVPPGTKTLLFKYKRPKFYEILTTRLKNSAVPVR